MGAITEQRVGSHPHSAASCVSLGTSVHLSGPPCPLKNGHHDTSITQVMSGAKEPPPQKPSVQGRAVCEHSTRRPVLRRHPDLSAGTRGRAVGCGQEGETCTFSAALPHS